MKEAIKKVFKEQIHNYLTSEQKNLFNNKDKLFDSLLELVFKNGITIFFDLFNSQDEIKDIREYILIKGNSIINSNNFLNGIINNYIRIFKETNETISEDGYMLIELLGDMHGEPSKFLVTKNDKKFIYCSAKNNSEKEITESLIIFDSKLENIFLKHIKINNSLYREYIEINNQSDSKQDIENYYYNLGYAIPYIIALRGVDLHWENILCNIPYPVFFDFETTFSPFLSKEQEEGYDILKTGLINIGSDGNSHSGVFGPLFKSYTSLYPIIEGDFPKPIISRKQFGNKRKDNALFLKGVICYPDLYSEFILQGYKDSSQKIKNNLKNFADTFYTTDFQSRAIIRISSFYESMIRLISYLSLQLSKEETYNELLNYFKQCPYFISFMPNDLFLKGEFELLYSGLIPIYYSATNKLGCINKDGEIIGEISHLTSKLMKMEIQDSDLFSKNYIILENQLSAFRKEINPTYLADYIL